MMLGFGQTEIDTAIAIINECYEAIRANADEAPTAVLQRVEKKYNDVAERNASMDRSDAPAR